MQIQQTKLHPVLPLTCYKPFFIMLGPVATVRIGGPRLCTDQCGQGNKVCNARPISSQLVGKPSVQWGCQTNSNGQQRTARHHFLPLTCGPNPTGIFQVPHSSNSQPFTSQHIRLFKASPTGPKHFNRSIGLLVTELLRDRVIKSSIHF